MPDRPDRGPRSSDPAQDAGPAGHAPAKKRKRGGVKHKKNSTRQESDEDSEELIPEAAQPSGPSPSGPAAGAGMDGDGP